jgi:hypothetical protein
MRFLGSTFGKKKASTGHHGYKSGAKSKTQRLWQEQFMNKKGKPSKRQHQRRMVTKMRTGRAEIDGCSRRTKDISKRVSDTNQRGRRVKADYLPSSSSIHPN